MAEAQAGGAPPFSLEVVLLGDGRVAVTVKLEVRLDEIATLEEALARWLRSRTVRKAT